MSPRKRKVKLSFIYTAFIYTYCGKLGHFFFVNTTVTEEPVRLRHL